MHEAQGNADSPVGDELAGNGDGGRRLLTANDVAGMLGVTVGWVYEQSRAGRIPTVTLGRYRRYRPEAIHRWVDQLER